MPPASIGSRHGCSRMLIRQGLSTWLHSPGGRNHRPPASSVNPHRSHTMSSDCPDPGGLSRVPQSGQKTIECVWVPMREEREIEKGVGVYARVAPRSQHERPCRCNGRTAEPTRALGGIQHVSGNASPRGLERDDVMERLREAVHQRFFHQHRDNLFPDLVWAEVPMNERWQCGELLERDGWEMADYVHGNGYRDKLCFTCNLQLGPHICSFDGASEVWDRSAAPRSGGMQRREPQSDPATALASALTHPDRSIPPSTE